MDMDQPPVTPPVMETGRPGPASDTSKLLAALGYLIPIVALIALLIDPYKNEKFVKFHAIQAIALWVVLVISNIIMAIPVIGWIIGFVVWIAVLVLGIMGLINAFQGKYWELPVLYGFIKGFVGE
jgi:uncharacterized membrane protein